MGPSSETLHNPDYRTAKQIGGLDWIPASRSPRESILSYGGGSPRFERNLDEEKVMISGRNGAAFKRRG